MTIHTSKWTKIIAVIFIIIAIICITCALYFRYIAPTLIGTSTTFATLAGAILVFSTLEIQRKTLEEEINKNIISQFDSRFFSILSSFRMDAANIESTLDRIREKGKGYGFPYSSSFYGDKAFYINRRILETLYNHIRKETFEKYYAEDISIELDEIGKKEKYLMENWPSDDDLDKIDKERINYLHSQQGSYLLYKYGITEDIWQQYKEADKEVVISFLLNLLLDYQPTILSKYIQTLRFILHIISGLSNEKDRKDYYLNISCLLGKEELIFLKIFKEFDIITNIQ